jgi:hypothetical protein
MLMFGLSSNLVMAVLSRCLCGALNGNVGVSKSVLGEITDSTNQPMAFAMFGFCWGVGGIGNTLFLFRLFEHELMVAPSLTCIFSSF